MSHTRQTFMDRNGENGLLAFLEKWEKAQGIKYETPTPFEDRWLRFLESPTPISLVF